jgi:transposase
MDYEDRIQAAIAELDSSDTRNYTQTAKKHDVNRSTLSRRHRNVTRSAAEFRSQSQQLLTTVQEHAILDYIESLGKRGLWMTPRTIRNLAEECVGHRIGKSWVGRFLKRHPTRLASVYLNGFDRSRFAAESAENTAKFFQNVRAF